MPLLTVDRHKESGLAQGVNDLQLLLAGVTGNMQTLALFIDHIGTLPVKLVDDLGNSLFVTGDSGCGNDDPVAGNDIDLLMGGEGHPVQSGHIFALRAGGNNDDLVLGQALDRT